MTLKLTGSTLPDDKARLEASYSYKRPLRAGIVAIALTFGGFGAWAITAPLDSAVIAPGVIKYENSRKQVQHHQGGIIQALHVREGELVSRDEPLLEIDDTELRSNATIFRQRLYAAQALEARLMAELHERPEIDFPEHLTDNTDDPWVRELVTTQQLLFEERRKSFQGRIDTQEARIRQLGQEIAGVRQQKESWEEQLRLLESELNELHRLQQQGYLSRTEILARQRERSRLSGEIGASVAESARVEKEIGTTRMQIAQLRQDTREAIVSELKTVRDEIEQLTLQLAVAESTLARTVVRAPASGIVHGLGVHTVGGVIQPGAVLMEILPLDDRLIIEAQVAPADIDSIKGGETAEVRLAAFKSRRIPVILGTVTHVSSDRFIDNQSGSGYYLARISVSDEELQRLGSNQEIQAGMPAEIFIQTGQRTMFQYLWQPLGEAISRGFRES